MWDKRPKSPDQTPDSPVMRAWEVERAASEPLERRHALITCLGAASAIVGLIAALSFGRPYLAPAMKAIKGALKNLF